MDLDATRAHASRSVGDRVDLVVPPSAVFLRTVRLVAADAAGRAGCDLDEIEDFRIAMDELMHLLMSATDHFVRMSVTTHERSVVGHGTATARISAAPYELDPVSEMIVRATADDFSVSSRENEMSFVVTKLVRRRDRVLREHPMSRPR